MTATDLRQCRSLLFLPASNPRAIEKARSVAADLVILDLEDAVKEEDKPAAREAAIAATAQGFGGRPVAVRVNAVDTPFFGEDVVSVRRCAADYVVLAKTETPKQAHDAAWLVGKPVLAMVETARGILEAAAIAPATRALIVGTNDLAASLHLPPDAGRRGLAHALQQAVLAARAGGVAVFDGVYNRLEADDALAAQCEEGRAFGFDGKSAIHPSQIETINRIFSPSAAEIDAARRLVEAATGGAERHEGKMIEAMHVEQARALIERAGGGKQSYRDLS